MKLSQQLAENIILRAELTYTDPGTAVGDLTAAAKRFGFVEGAKWMAESMDAAIEKTTSSNNLGSGEAK